MSKTWLITGVSSGFGYEMTKQLLEKSDTVIGTVRNKDKVEEIISEYPDTFDCRILDVTDVPAVHAVVDDAFAKHGRIDVIVSNAGYGLFGAAEELTDDEVNHINWWGTLPQALFTFLEEYDFSGKTILPLCTHEGSCMGRSEGDISSLCSNAKLLDRLAVRGSSASSAQSQVESRIRDSGILD